MPKPVQLIVACAENRVIGRDRALPFHIPEDKAWFHDRTANQVVVLGRICFETWPRVLRDGRKPVVISSQPDLILRLAEQKREPSSFVPRIARNVPEALALAEEIPGDIMVCGGQRIYEETLPIADRLLLTLVHAPVEGDVYFPEWRQFAWKETWKHASSDTQYRYTFSILDRVR